MLWGPMAGVIGSAVAAGVCLLYFSSFCEGPGGLLQALRFFICLPVLVFHFLNLVCCRKWDGGWRFKGLFPRGSFFTFYRFKSGVKRALKLPIVKTSKSIIVFCINFLAAFFSPPVDIFFQNIQTAQTSIKRRFAYL